ncbi:MAG: hypothetical protein K2J39_11895, partial [Ruminococcus sp.]|nr:hypothetical protein [Ruminococcus sp.]
MKKILSVFTTATLLVTAFAFPNCMKSQAEPIQESETIQYTGEDLKNLQDFLLVKETSDLSGKNYDLDNDGILSVFDLCLMRKQFSEKQSNNKTLIAYFSLGRNSGNFETADATTSASIVIEDNSRYGATEYIANLIQQEVGGDLYSIEVAEPYSTDFDEVVSQNHNEMAENYLPELAGEIPDISQYDTIYIGYPVWATTIPRAIHTFLNQYDLSGKTVIPFCTHNGYGKGRSERDIAELCSESKVLEGSAINSENILSSRETVAQWLDKIGMLENKETEIKISVGEHTLDGVIYDTPLAKEIMDMMPLTVSMYGYGGREYYGSMPSVPENTGDGQLNFENGDITYCPKNNSLAIFYAQTSRPNLTMEVIPIGKVTSDLSVFDTLGSRENITFSIIDYENQSLFQSLIHITETTRRIGRSNPV